MIQTVMSRLRLVAAIAALGAVFALGAVACGDDGDNGEPTATEEPMETEPLATEPATGAELPEVQITGLDYSYDAPESIVGGYTRITFENASDAEDHQAQLFRLNEGATFDDFTAALPEGEAAVFALGTAAGGPGAGPGLANENVLNLDAGSYVLLCLIPSPSDGVSHAAKGMIQPLEVTEAAAEAPEVPAADVAVGLSDFAFDAPATIPAGETTFGVTNNGPQPHEMALLRLAEGLTVEALLDLFAATPDPNAPPPEGPPPFTFLGQVAVMGNGVSGQTTIDLVPGTYTLLCFVTDPDSGAPHAALGMSAEIVAE
jgi:hypothetical protein